MKSAQILILLFFVPSLYTCAQSPYILRGDQAYHTYDRTEILRMTDTSLSNAVNNYDRKLWTLYFKTVLKNNIITGKDKYDLMHVFSDNYEFLEADMYTPKTDTNFFTERNSVLDDNHFVFTKDFDKKPILKYFYKTPANFLQIDVPSFKVMINPVLQVSHHNQIHNDNIIFQNTRGIDIRGYIENKLYFHTQLLENQRNYPNFTEAWIQKFSTLPGQGFWKNYQSNVLTGLKGYDFFNARAYVGFNPLKSINIEFGHGNHFIGNGHRSLLLSDFSHNYFYLKFNTRIWKLHYQNIFAELAPITTLLNPGDRLLPKKYAATHFLTYKPHNNLEFGLFETVIFARPNHFELQYLNPIILYRAVEHYLDSPDNVILGLNAKWNPVKGISLYGQFVMDEFKLSEVKKQSGWWANKFGGQLGIKYINAFGIDHLDLQFEINAVRPYTYAHRDTLAGFPKNSVANYSHSNQSLAHPLGANFREALFIMKYKPLNRLYIQAKGIMTTFGDDGPAENWGGNILRPLETIEMQYGNKIGQGINTSIKAINLDLSYEVFHNYFVDLQAVWRQTNTEFSKDQHYIGGGMRVNISNITYDY